MFTLPTMLWKSRPAQIEVEALEALSVVSGVHALQLEPKPQILFGCVHPGAVSTPRGDVHRRLKREP